jgi:hypothetical protein
MLDDQAAYPCWKTTYAYGDQLLLGAYSGTACLAVVVTWQNLCVLR